YIDDPESNNVPQYIIPDGDVPYSVTCLIMYSVAATFQTQLSEPNYYYGPWRDSVEVSLANHTPSYLQRHPFDDLCPIENGAHCPAGCGPIAMLITIAYRGAPNTIANISAERELLMDYESDTLNSYPILSAWARELGRLGNATYSANGTSMTNQKLISTMQSLGYSMCGNDVDVATMVNMLRNDKPVILSGFNFSRRGHCYVVDAVKLKTRDVYYVVNNDEVVRNTTNDIAVLMYLNMGWEEVILPSGTVDTYNGWYVYPYNFVITSNPVLEYSRRMRMYVY
ncbi:MAG: C10 family peptidase, partial [Bacteroidales bacterium]|nr:C10 family peptidase [Bacteroidales bacterium]